MERGYTGIGIYRGKYADNIGTLWRSAQLYGADFIFTIANRYTGHRTDTLKTPRHIPLFQFQNYEDFQNSMPLNADIVCIEQGGKHQLAEANHPEQSIYLLGAEDDGLPEDVMRGNQTIEIETEQPRSMNVATAGSIVLHDRYVNKIQP